VEITHAIPDEVQEARAFRLLLVAAGGVAVVVLACAVVVAAELPFGEWDALSYGAWAREIASHWPHFQFADAAAIDLHRPFFYFLEGTAWSIFGFHQAVGRLLALAFGAILVVALAYAAGRTAPRRYGPAAAAIMLAIVVACIPFERYVVSGLTDVPVAAMIAMTAALLVLVQERPRLLPVVGLAACLSMLTKPTALASLLGLATALLLGARTSLPRRAAATGWLLGGTALALLYDAFEAHRLHLGLAPFLKSGSDGFYASLAASRRGDVLLDESWLGGDLRLLLLFSLAYAAARLLTNHRVAVLLALPGALAWSIAGPHLADGGTRGVVPESGGTIQSVAVLVLAGSLLFACAAPVEAVPSRLELGRLLVWLVPPLVVWIVYSAYDVRLLSAAWPPLLLLIGRALLPVFGGAASIDLLGVVVPAGALLVLTVFATLQLNGLGHDGWSRFSSALGSTDELRSLALGGDFDAELTALRSQLPTTRTIVTADGRLRFYYPHQVVLEAPESCAQLTAPATTLVILESDEERAVYGDRAGVRYWQSCRRPTATLVAERPGAFALFTTAHVAAALDGCGANPTAGLSVEFGRFSTATAANRLLRRARLVGFIQARVERLGCSLYRVVEIGVPTRDVGRSIVAEAQTAQLRAHMVALAQTP
jgi:hypothetical protein